VRVTKTDPALDRPITLEFTATEQWNDRLFDASGSLMEDRSGSRAWHYVISSAADLLPSGSAASGPATQCSGLSQWLIVDALPSTP
jgi:hypothetical protein